jgi:hypothetical protein
MDNDAKTFYLTLEQQLTDLRILLDQGERLAAYYHGPGGEFISITGIGYKNPDLIFFEGQNLNGDECYILANVNAAHLTLKIQKDRSKTEQPKQIGFLGEQHSKRSASKSS